MLALAALLVPSCTTTPTAEQRELFVADLQDALDIVAPLVGSEGAEYLAAVRTIADALLRSEELDWVAAFNAVRALEPLVVTRMIEGGMKAEEATAVLALTRIPLRHLEHYLLGGA